MNNSYIKLYRSLMDNPIWSDKPFSRGQAWVDLLMLAKWKDEKKMNGQTLHRGEVGVSKLWLADRWGWSRRKVTRFLSVLEVTKMCTVKSTTNGTTLTIENYNIYQGEGTTEGTTEGTISAQRMVQRAPTLKEIKNSNKEKNIIKREMNKEKRETVPEAHSQFAPYKAALMAEAAQRIVAQEKEAKQNGEHEAV